MGKSNSNVVPAVNNSGAVVLREITYQTNGGIKFNGVLCDPLDVDWKEEIVGKEKILTIKAISADNYPLFFECRSKKSMFGSYDTNNDMIEKFKKDFGSQIFVRRLIISINEGHPNYISAPGGLLLKSGEGVLLNTNGVTLSQQSTKTSYYHGGVSVKVSKHVRVGGGKSTPVKENYEKVLDTGSLCLTNSRLIFIGRDKTATIELNKIVNLEFYSNALYVTKDGVQKTFHFSGVDGNMYQGVISALRR